MIAHAKRSKARRRRNRNNGRRALWPCPAALPGDLFRGGCSSDVFINGIPAAVVGSTTTERDSCCGSSQGSVAAGSGSVFINRKSAARLGDALNAHSGSGAISAGSGNVFIGG